MRQNINQVGILGAGAWGAALAMVAVRAGRCALVWTNSESQMQERQQQLEFPRDITWTTSLQSVAQAPLILVAVPAQVVRPVMEEIRPALNPHAILLNCAKGIEQNTFLLMTEVMATVVPNHRLGALSGPNFAREVVQGLPAATTIAIDPKTVTNPGETLALALEICESLASPSFRPYASRDVIGVQIAGVVKNVLAIACGMAHGLGLGENARAALIARGLREMRTLGLVRGAQEATFYGLAGVGDLVLTGSSPQSRNFTLGMMIAQKGSIDVNLMHQGALTEGVFNAATVMEMANRHQVHVPLITATAQILSGNLPIHQALHDLLNRPLAVED
jgi:glycerol-3-phosphate dehydrogenase (NAD(P)+)